MKNLLTLSSKAILSFLSSFGITPQRGRIDGTVMGKMYITCCSTNLGGYEIILNAVMCEGRGKELEGAKEIVEKVDKEFEELVQYELDGLYYARTFIRKTRKKVLIKSKEQRLEVFKKLEWYVKVLEEFPEIACDRCKVVEGYDAKRGRSYKIVVVDGVEDENLGMEVEVGKVIERCGDAEEEYYILSTQTGVEPQRLREMAIERWGIEISFRESNLIMNTKRLRSHNPTS
ncbi:MAG: hypothetical protein RMJ37_03935, partial [Spirochaetia bacterium]|nr:hypothetical protein [Spirochaetota bacterium]MDW8112478.1 hypothetical protein [Spirochaetia bacterium]